MPADLFELVGELLTVRDASPLLDDCVVQLERSYRHDDAPGIAALARAVYVGDAEVAVQLLTSGDYPDIALRPGATEKGLGAPLRRSVVEGYRGYLAEKTDPLRAAAALGRYRVPCAHRRGPFGASLLKTAGAAWYDGRPVLVTENEDAVNLFNGDVGFARRAEDGCCRCTSWARTGRTACSRRRGWRGTRRCSR